MDDDGLCAQCSHELYLEKMGQMGQIGEMGQAYDNVEVKTERLEPDVDVCSRAAEGSRQPDDIERDDFEEENRLLAHCPELIVNRKLKYSQSGKSSLSSSSETISLNDMPTDYSRPGCSRDLPDDSNSTIKKMIKSKTYPVEKEDFMQKLLNSNIEEKKNFPKGKLYKAEVMEGVIIDSSMCGLHGGGPSGRTSSNASSIGSMGSDSTKEFSVPSTSNADKLLGLDDSGKRSDAGSSKSSNYRQKYCDDDSDDDHEESLCTCSSSHEDDDDEDEADPEPDRHWRKRRYEPPQPQVAKRFCPDGSFDGNLGEQWGAGGSGLQGSASPQGPPEVNQWLNRFTSWTDSEKTRAIDALIGCCAAGQVRHMMKAIEPLFQRDFISLLPKELALTVLAYLQPKDLLRAAQTCRYWRFLADDNLLWKEQCRRIGITTLKARCLTRSLPRCASPWKAAYMRQYLIENNWLQKPVDNPIVMRGHDDHVITCLQFYGNRILSGSDDTTLKVWSAVTGRCLRTLVGHSGGVWSSQMVGHLVISGSTDRTLRVWNARTGQCIKVLAGHTSTVRCMHLHDNRVVSGSRDATLRVWSIPDGRCMRVLVGHIAAVRCVQFDGKYVVSGAYDYFVKIWNPDTGECLHTLSGHTNRVYSLQKLRLSCEPSLFAMEQLLISMAANVHTSRPLQLLIQPVLAATFKQELSDRQRLLEKNIRLMSDEAFEQNLRRGSRQLQQNGECAYCRRHLFLSRVVGVVEGDLCSRHGLALYEQAQARQERLDNATCIKMMPHGADHIKNYVTVAGDMTLAVGPSELAKDIIDKIKRRVSRYYDVIEVAENEAANCLFVNQTLIHQAIEEIPESFKVCTFWTDP